VKDEVRQEAAQWIKDKTVDVVVEEQKRQIEQSRLYDEHDEPIDYGNLKPLHIAQPSVDPLPSDNIKKPVRNP
jgi:hypothetical protein